MRHHIVIETSQDLFDNRILTKKALREELNFKFSGCYGIVYKITHKRSKKTYIGITTESLTSRILKAFKSDNNQSISKAIRRQNATNFKVEVIDYGMDREDLIAKEKEYILYYAFLPHGVFNENQGGGGIR